MIFLPDTNACISLLRQRNPKIIARWQAVKVTDVVLCSVVVYELRHGAERSTNPLSEHAKLDAFLKPFATSSKGQGQSLDHMICKSPPSHCNTGSLW